MGREVLSGIVLFLAAGDGGGEDAALGGGGGVEGVGRLRLAESRLRVH